MSSVFIYDEIHFSNLLKAWAVFRNLSDVITVVIPALNEDRNLPDIIKGSQRFTGDILVVDGHSQDGTAAVARALGAAVIFDHRKGKGDAIRTAIPFIKKEVTVFIDADGSHNPEDIPRLVQPIIDDRADHVSGSRLIGGSSELHGGFDEFFRLAGSSLITACINRRFNVRLSDSQNGFRALRTAVLHALDLRENITTIEQEMIIKTLKGGFRMAEVPTHEHRRRAGRSKIVVRRVAFRYIFSMLKHLWF
jgi:glycosyltransferase involved in cell wall biosynthesis